MTTVHSSMGGTDRPPPPPPAPRTPPLSLACHSVTPFLHNMPEGGHGVTQPNPPFRARSLPKLTSGVLTSRQQAVQYGLSPLCNLV